MCSRDWVRNSRGKWPHLHLCFGITSWQKLPHDKRSSSHNKERYLEFHIKSFHCYNWAHILHYFKSYFSFKTATAVPKVPSIPSCLGASALLSTFSGISGTLIFKDVWRNFLFIRRSKIEKFRSLDKIWERCWSQRWVSLSNAPSNPL